MNIDKVVLKRDPIFWGNFCRLSFGLFFRVSVSGEGRKEGKRRKEGTQRKEGLQVLQPEKRGKTSQNSGGKKSQIISPPF